MSLKQSWKDMINKSITDKRWDEYDETIRAEVSTYIQRFTSTLKNPPNWLYIKAMLWTESGGPDNPSWKTRPMQIGNPGDPAYEVLKNGKEGASKIMNTTLREALKSGSINKPNINIKAGIAYLFTRMAIQESVLDEQDNNVYEYKVVKGDTFEGIAEKKGTTVTELKNRNPTVIPTLIKPDQILKYRKARIDIVRWRTFSFTEIAERYNGNGVGGVGDSEYANKLIYIINEVFPKLKRDDNKTEKVKN